jgi:N6-L-threonylcarbamoyladenine synthase
VEELGYGALSLVGGVAANQALRNRLSEGCARLGVQFMTPPFALCTDNAAMIGLSAVTRLARGEHDTMDLDVWPNSELPVIPA